MKLGRQDSVCCQAVLLINFTLSIDTTSVAETRLHNPSLGDGASVGGLTGLSLSVSGSHMERCGMSVTQRDNMSDNASTTALAGTSITGSLSGSCYNR